MKKTKRLVISRETVRQLGINELGRAIVGGISGRACSIGRTGCAECDDTPSLLDTNCASCVQTDGCTAGCTGFPCKYP